MITVITPAIHRFHAFLQTQFHLPLLTIQTNNGREFDNHASRTFFASHGIQPRMSCPYTSSQNGRAERALRTLNDITRTLMFHASMPLRFWVDALATATFLLNRRPCRPCQLTTPFELLYGVPPDYSPLRVFGGLCYPNTLSTTPHKLAPRSTACTFLGYSPDHKGYVASTTLPNVSSCPVTFSSMNTSFCSPKPPHLLPYPIPTTPDATSLRDPHCPLLRFFRPRLPSLHAHPAFLPHLPRRNLLPPHLLRRLHRLPQSLPQLLSLPQILPPFLPRHALLSQILPPVLPRHPPLPQLLPPVLPRHNPLPQVLPPLLLRPLPSLPLHTPHIPCVPAPNQASSSPTPSIASPAPLLPPFHPFPPLCAQLCGILVG
ncbi:uncharacterized protein LOC106865377 isoform X1 [Brachypodium distachyon]|uniref:uncharacterized protein LOC106865377 isoform X1 n=1 Tax=Brachypodium distachyon TaxID=15368 RepID=UPI000D0CA09B|nr:uncharacterized protein LOC106865377 isoform X1 [Brachypodium distachyon]|eukprot:XP_024317011.1 uncharacterized protein LOC106865377 isoform X1 [Brachypodium distachyon]